MMQAVYRTANGRNSLSHTKDGKKHGLHWVWDARTGLLLSEYPLCNDAYHGIMRQWHFNGRLHSECYYYHGVQKGLERSYHGNGKLMREVLWVNGEKHGVQRTWNLLGHIYSETSFEKGVMHGQAQLYDADGEQFGPDAHYYCGKLTDRKVKGFALIGKKAVPVDGAFYGRERSEKMSIEIIAEEAFVEVDDIPRPSHYDMALGAVAAHKVKRWHSEGLGPEEIRSALIETKNTVDTYKES